MKKVLLAIVAICAITGVAFGQGFSLQVGESAAACAQGLMRASAGINVGDEVMFYGVRGAYGVMEGLQVFADAGMADSDDMDSAMSVQAGAIYALPLQMPVDLAVRAAIAKPFFDDIEIPSYYGYGGGTLDVSVLVMSAMLLASKDMSDMMAGVTGYAGVGFARTSIEIGDEDDSETDLALAVGAIYNVSEQLSVFGEVDIVDDPFFGGGARFDF